MRLVFIKFPQFFTAVFVRKTAGVNHYQMVGKIIMA
jgi:hypothetical protein